MASLNPVAVQLCRHVGYVCKTQTFQNLDNMRIIWLVLSSLSQRAFGSGVSHGPSRFACIVSGVFGLGPTIQTCLVSLHALLGNTRSMPRAVSCPIRCPSLEGNVAELHAELSASAGCAEGRRPLPETRCGALQTFCPMLSIYPCLLVKVSCLGPGSPRPLPWPLSVL